MRPEFVAIDGEADAQGRYILLCDSTGRVLHNPAGIGSQQAFEFLLPLQRKHRQIVCFGLNYDANQWLKDLAPPYLRRLAADGKTVWKFRYKLTWWPSKYFAIKDHKYKRSVKVCEVFGFFQTSFVNALRTWGMEPPAEIETMKGKRGTFTQAELGRIIRYCQEECRLLVQLMDRLADACERAECLPRRDWIGAGAIASSLLRSQGVSHHLVHDAELADRDTVENVILGAYYGGRVELLAQGTMPVCHTRDIRSAYPAAAVELPSLIGAKVVHRKRYAPDEDWSIWRVSWHKQAHGQLAPFPVRADDGSISYPHTGAGAYHQAEVRNALALGYDITIHGGIVLRARAREALPFQWIPGVFAHRARLKAKGDAAEKALKLGLNSVYGKLAQGYGHGRPPFQQYWWAGHITSRTRARMLAIAHRSEHVCMISTDGIFAMKAGARGTSRATLGTWEAGRVDDLFCAQPGVYRGMDGERVVTKSRGFFAKEVDYDDLRAVYEEEGTSGAYHYNSRRFIGLRVALHRNRLDLWRAWVTEPRTIGLEPQRKLITGETHPRTGMTLLYPPEGGIESVPYTPKQSLYDDPGDRDLENMIHDDQPHYDGA